MLEKHISCPKETVVNQLIRTQARVTIRPIVKHGRPRIHCLGSDVKPSYDWDKNPKLRFTPDDWEIDSESLHLSPAECDRPENKCSFILTQLLCVEIPIEFDADVDVNGGIVHCSEPNIGPCKPKPMELNDEDSPKDG